MQRGEYQPRWCNFRLRESSGIHSAGFNGTAISMCWWNNFTTSTLRSEYKKRFRAVKLHNSPSMSSNMSRFFLCVLLIHVILTAEACFIKENKVRRFNLILPTGRVVRSIVSHRHYVLISLDTPVIGEARHSSDRVRQVQRGVRKYESTVITLFSKTTLVEIEQSRDNKRGC